MRGVRAGVPAVRANASTDLETLTYPEKCILNGSLERGNMRFSWMHLKRRAFLALHISHKPSQPHSEKWLFNVVHTLRLPQKSDGTCCDRSCELNWEPSGTEFETRRHPEGPTPTPACWCFLVTRRANPSGHSVKETGFSLPRPRHSSAGDGLGRAECPPGQVGPWRVGVRVMAKLDQSP